MTQEKKMTPIDFVKSENTTHQVVVWSKSYCPYCQQTKKLFKSIEGVNMVVHELDQMEDGYRYQQALFQLTGQRSVPNVFVRGVHVGGNDDTQKANQVGILRDLLFMGAPESM